MSLHNQVEDRGDPLQHLRNSISSSLGTRLPTKQVGSLYQHYISYDVDEYPTTVYADSCKLYVDLLRAQEHSGGICFYNSLPIGPQ